MVSASLPIIACVGKNQEAVRSFRRWPHGKAAIFRAVAGPWRKNLLAGNLAAERTCKVPELVQAEPLLRFILPHSTNATSHLFQRPAFRHNARERKRKELAQRAKRNFTVPSIFSSFSHSHQARSRQSRNSSFAGDRTTERSTIACGMAGGLCGFVDVGRRIEARRVQTNALVF
jgi:hypothetical protein